MSITQSPDQFTIALPITLPITLPKAAKEQQTKATAPDDGTLSPRVLRMV